MNTAQKTNDEAEAAHATYSLFDRWFDRHGHWIYASKDVAFSKWIKDGIDGLPRAPARLGGVR